MCFGCVLLASRLLKSRTIRVAPPLNSHSAGFTLVELAIVLVIVGLLAGGVMVGGDMIRAAELRSVTASLDRYRSAVLVFRDKYMGLPGDLKNATAFWGVQAGTGSDTACFNSASTTKATCNGNGDGLILTVDGLSYSERFRAWQHLANAGLIEGTYSGYGGPIATEARTPDVNVPSVKGGGSGYYYLTYLSPFTSHAQFFDRTQDGHVVFVEAPGYIFTPEEVQRIDMKLDDGKPATGQVFVYKSTSTWMPNCATTDVASTAVYNVANKAKICYAVFEIDY